jgi:putative copper export protein
MKILTFVDVLVLQVVMMESSVFHTDYGVRLVVKLEVFLSSKTLQMVIDDQQQNIGIL